ncbi:MAG: hypothetical protein ACLT8W_14145 [Bacteroides caccae]
MRASNGVSSDFIIAGHGTFIQDYLSMSFTAIQFNDLALGNMPCLVEHFYIKGFADGAWHIVLSIYRVGFKPYSISYIITTIIKMQVYLLTWVCVSKSNGIIEELFEDDVAASVL